MENSDVFRLDGQTLRLFLSLCETSSVSKTAEAFGLNQSTVSYGLEKLRSAVGDPLFVRSGRGITPTDKAIALQPRVQEILAGLEGLVASEQYDPRIDSRPFIIAVPSPAFLPEIRKIEKTLHAQSARSMLEVRRLAPRERLTEMLSSGDVDLAIAVADGPYKVVLNHCDYGKDDLVVFYDPVVRGPVWAPEEYARARHAVTGFGGKTPSIVDRALASASITRKVALAAPTASSLRDLIPGTDMIATMPRAMHNSVLQNLAYCAPPFDLPPVVHHLVWHRRYDHSGRNQWLRRVVLAARNANQHEGALADGPGGFGPAPQHAGPKTG